VLIEAKRFKRIEEVRRELTKEDLVRTREIISDHSLTLNCFAIPRDLANSFFLKIVMPR